jgi:hypothetical protein
VPQVVTTRGSEVIAMRERSYERKVVEAYTVRSGVSIRYATTAEAITQDCVIAKLRNGWRSSLFVCRLSGQDSVIHCRSFVCESPHSGKTQIDGGGGRVSEIPTRSDTVMRLSYRKPDEAPNITN